MNLKKIFVPFNHKKSATKAHLSKVFSAKFENKRIHFYAPLTLCVYDDESSYITYQFIEYIEDLVFKHGIPITIDFSRLVTLSAAASLLVFAKITKCQICIIEPNAIEIVPPTNKETRSLFTSSGLWNGIKPGGISKIRKLIDNNNQYMSGSREIIDNYSKVILATIISLANQNVKFTIPITHTFTKGIQEAILNVSYHAYDINSIAVKYDGLNSGRWWQCCWLDDDKNQLVFIIYDDGIGIADSLKNNYPTNTPDHTLIKEAMTMGITSSNDSSRGKGSNDIINASCTFPNSHLIIMSGQGFYKHDEDGPQSKKLTFTLKGTLIQWVLNYTKEALR